MEPQAAAELELLLFAEPDAFEEAAQLFEGDAGSPLAFLEVGRGAAQSGDELLEFFEHAVDRAAGELHLAQGVDTGLAMVANLLGTGLPALFAGVFFGREGGSIFFDVLLVAADPVELLLQVFEGQLLVDGQVVFVRVRVCCPRPIVGGCDGDDFFDASLAALELVVKLVDVGDRNGAVKDEVEDFLLSPLDTLGDLDFAFAGEKRDGAHLAQVHADGIVGTSAILVALLGAALLALYFFGRLIGDGLALVHHFHAFFLQQVFPGAELRLVELSGGKKLDQLFPCDASLLGRQR